MSNSMTQVLSASDLVRLRISHRTADIPNADTNSPVSLHVYSKDGTKLDSFSLDHPDYNDRERGRTDAYDVIPSAVYTVEGIWILRLQIYADDAWLPSSIVVEGLTRGGIHYLLHANTSWGSWLSTDTGDCNGWARPYYDLLINPRGLLQRVDVHTNDDFKACDPTERVTT